MSEPETREATLSLPPYCQPVISEASKWSVLWLIGGKTIKRK